MVGAEITGPLGPSHPEVYVVAAVDSVAQSPTNNKNDLPVETGLAVVFEDIADRSRPQIEQADSLAFPGHVRRTPAPLLDVASRTGVL